MEATPEVTQKRPLNNAEIADNKVDKVRKLIVAAGQHKMIPITVSDLLTVLDSLERLSALERHLYNLTSLYKANA